MLLAASQREPIIVNNKNQVPVLDLYFKRTSAMLSAISSKISALFSSTIKRKEKLESEIIRHKTNLCKSGSAYRLNIEEERRNRKR